MMFYGEHDNAFSSQMMRTQQAVADTGSGDGKNVQKYGDFPGEHPTKAGRSEWARRARAKHTREQDAAMRGEVPSKLKAETAEFPVSSLAMLPRDADAKTKAARDEKIAAHVASNTAKLAYREDSMREVRHEVAKDVLAARDALC